MGTVVVDVPCSHSKLELEPDRRTTSPRRLLEKKALEVALHVAQGSLGFVVSCGRSRGDSPLFWERVEVGKVCILQLLVWKRMPICEEVRFGETLS